MKYLGLAAIVLLLATTIAYAEGPPLQSLQLAGVPCDVASCHIPTGWTGVVPPNVTISGDIRINNEPLYDTLQQTGLVIYTGAITNSIPVTVTAEWGADAKAGDWLKTKMEDLLVNGCGLPTGCALVEGFDLATGASLTFGTQ